MELTIIYSSTVRKYNFEELYVSIFIFCSLYTSTLSNLFDNFNYFAVNYYHLWRGTNQILLWVGH